MQIQGGKQGYKQTIIGEIPEEWEIANLRDVCTKITDGVHKTPKYQDQGIPFISVNNIATGELDFSDCKYISHKDHEELIRRCFPHKEDILLGKVGTLGVADIVNVDFEFSIFVQIALLEPDRNKVVPQYLKYVLNSTELQKAIQKNASGTTLKYIGINKIGILKIPLQSIPEEQKIASVLSRVDELIQNTDQVIEQTKKLKNGLMQKLLTRGIGHTRYKSVRFGPRFLEYNIPDKWQVATLKQCVRSETSITYGIVQAGPHVPDGIPYIRTGDMSGDKLSIDGMLRTSKEIASSYPRSQVKAGEIVCALRGIVGKVLEVPEELDGANLTQGTARISPRHDIVYRCLLWSLRSEYARRQFEIFSKGTTLNEITLEQLRTIKVAIPSDIKEQKDLAHILDQSELKIGLQLRHKEKLLVLKAGLMQQLLTGKIRVKV